MNFDKLEKIYESKNSAVYKGMHQGFEKEVIVKILNTEFPDQEQIQRFDNEFETTNFLEIEGIRKALSKEYSINNYKLILEYFTGITLKQYFAENALNIPDFLKIAIKISQVLGEIHLKKIIHKDINSNNILVNKNGDIQIIDFGISSKYNIKYQNLSNPEHLQGTLAYISPEQTGRMNRTIDYRTDIYSLGVILYEALTGKLPFEETDSMQLIHSHIATKPKALNEINPNVPKILSDIVLKLLEKNAENRYQSAFGLKHDLLKVSENLNNDSLSFTPGEKDYSGRLSIPEILYGREDEISKLIEIYEDVSRGSCELLLISGFSGVGKSALVHEIHKPVTKKRGIYIEGKFDQYQRNVPYFAIIQAFTDAINSILKENDKQLNYWKRTIQKAVNNFGQVIVNLIPDLELVIGKQEELPQLEGKEALNRFNYVWTNFMKAVCKPEHPLVLFIDDLQWADNASLNLLKVLLTDTEIMNFLCIAAYRDNETDASHPFIRLTEELQSENVEIKAFKLGNLKGQHIDNLLLDALNIQSTDGKNKQSVEDLSEIIYEKTLGNAFFTQQFIKTLYEEKLLYFDFETNLWKWDLINIKNINITDNVLELMANKITKLPESSQEVLRIAACIGNRFDFEILNSIYLKPAEETNSDLEFAIYEGLIIPMENDDFKFVHDRIQQAVYSTIPDDKKNNFHYQAGKLFLKSVQKNDIDKKVFDIVNQLNYGIQIIIDPNEKRELSLLNFKAGIKAKASSAYETAYSYIKISRNLLSQSAWQNDYQYTLSVFTELTETAYLNNEYKETQEYAQNIVQNSVDVLDTARALYTQLNSLRAQGKYAEAISQGLDLSEKLGVKIPRKISKLYLLNDLLRTLRSVKKDKKTLYNMPVMSDKRIQNALKTLDVIGTSAYITNPPLLAVMVFRSVQLAMKYGYYDSSPYSMSAFGMIICSLNKVEKAQFMGELATHILENYNSTGVKCKTNHINLFYITNWKNQIHELLDDIYENYKTGLETGDFEFAGYSLMYWFGLSLNCKTNLNELKNTVEKHSGRIAKLSTDNNTRTNLYFLQTIENLTKPDYKDCSLNGEFYNEDIDVPALKQNKTFVGLARYYQLKVFLFYLFDKSEQIETILPEIDSLKGAGKEYYFHALLNFYSSLCLLDTYKNSKSSRKTEILNIVKKNQKKMLQWAKHCPQNFEHKYFLVEAQRMKVTGKISAAKEFYDKAITGADIYGFIQEEAICFEAAGEFYLEQNQPVLAKNYLQNAYRTYNTWGAISKLKHLESKYPQFISVKLLSNISGGTETSTHTTTVVSTTAGHTSGNLELNSIIKASQSLAGEVNIERLLKNMLMIIMENAGADYAVFLKNEEGNFLIQAKGNYNDKQFEILQSESIENSNSIPLNIVKYVIRTNKPIVLDDATNNKTFSDEYINNKKVKSVFCFPITHKKKQVAVLYLENNLSTHVFTPDRIETVSILSSQIAVSIENAVLYESLENKVEQRTLQLQNAKEELEKSHKHITDSIKYAQRIQKAVIPASETVKQLFSEYFIYFKPRDIVSGDFYFVKKLGTKIYLAVADCTGHGVPGAFMSMLGITILNELVLRAEISNSAQILDELRNRIKNSLQQKGQTLEQQDGMDICFVTIDTEKNSLSYAGAYNSLIIFRNSELLELKPDRMPVGIYNKEHPFTNNEFDLKNDDILYLFSDGYYSQFRQKSKDTMKNTRFKKLLGEIQSLKLDEQKQKLDEYLNNWKGNEPQVDDILVVGVKI